MKTNFPGQIEVQVLKSGWFKRSYQFMADNIVLGQLDYEKSYCKKATGKINGQEFSIRRVGFWKHQVEIESISKQYNTRLDISWRNTMIVADSTGNSYTFRSTGIWGNKWQWLDRYKRPLIEIRSNNYSKTKRGLVEIKDPVMNETLFWIMVSWFVIICSESDAAAAVGM